MNDKSDKVELLRLIEARESRGDLTSEWVAQRLRLEALREDSPPAARVAALKSLADYVGGFDANNQKHSINSEQIIRVISDSEITLPD